MTLQPILIVLVCLLLFQCLNPVSVNNNNTNGGLIVSEIMYNDGTDSLEFIELKNTSSDQINLSGMFFSDGIEFSFPEKSVIGGGKYLVLTNDQELFESRYPGASVGGVFSGKIDDNGEKVTLKNANQEKIFSIEFHDGGFWPSCSDGLGFSLVTVDENNPGDQNDYNDWRASSKKGGSPGKKDLDISIPHVLVDEVIISGHSTRIDKVEIYNPDSFLNADISGWFISDDCHRPEKFKIPAHTTIKPLSYAVFSGEEMDTTMIVSSAGGQVYIFSTDASGSLTGYSHGIDFESADPGTSFGLVENSDGKFFSSRLSESSIGTVNASPATGDVVISEIMYHPSKNGNEFLEIINRTDGPLELYDKDDPSNVWVIKGVSFTFSRGMVIGGGERIVLVDSTAEIDSFRNAWQIDSSVKIFHFDGKLANEGETISIEKPGKPWVDENGLIEVPYTTVDVVSYKNSSPWPKKADGEGYSLIRTNLTAWGNEPGNWKCSDENGGTPGK